MMLEELQRRNYSQTTVQTYLKSVQAFAEHFDTPPDQLGLEHIRSYQAYLFQVKKLAASTVGLCTAALRFFLVKTLRRPYPVEEVPYPKTPRRLPTVLTQEEAARLINSASNLFHRAILMTLYATGVRRVVQSQGR
jgi:site-specific recombinase XerD